MRSSDVDACQSRPGAVLEIRQLIAAVVSSQHGAGHVPISHWQAVIRFSYPSFSRIRPLQLFHLGRQRIKLLGNVE